MSKILFDGNNCYQRWLMNDISGAPIRNMALEIASTPGQPIVVWDGRGALQKRRETLPAYKSKRESKGEDVYAGMRLLQQTLHYRGVVQIEVPGFEADDVIAAIVRDDLYIVEHIHTNDEDLAALGVPTDRTPKIEPRWIPLYKASVGDPSDNISGIKGFGEKAWADLDTDHAVILSRILFKDEDRVKELEGVLKKSVFNWLLDNLDHARRCAQVVNFQDVPIDKFKAGISCRSADIEQAEEVLRQYEVG